MSAQSFYQPVHRPAHVKYDVLKTEHFDLIFQRGLDTLVYEAAITLEDAYEHIRDVTGFKQSFSMPVVLNNYSDVSNGFVSAAPFRQEITAAPIKGKRLSPRHSDWLRQVLPHEMVHAAQGEFRAGFGVGSILRVMSPDLGRSLNLGIPAGMTEGLAVFHEGDDRDGSGRLNFSMTLMQYRAAAASGAAWRLGELLDAPGFTQPFNRHYVGGGKLTEFLTDSVDTDFFYRTLRFYNRVPFFGYGIALWQGTGQAPWNLSAAFTRYARELEFERIAGLGALSQPTVLTDKRGLACRRPKFIDATTILAHCRGYEHAPGFYTIDTESGRRDLAFKHAVTEDFVLSLDRERASIAFARYHPDLTVTVSSRSRLHILDLDSGRDQTLPGSLRLYAPIRVDDAHVWALRDAGQFNEIVELGPNGSIRLIFREFGMNVREMAVGPGGDVLVLANRSGEQALHLLGRRDGDWSLEPLLAVRDGSIYDPEWLPDGSGIVFAADPSTVSNIYLYDLAHRRVHRLTNVKFGAVEPSVSPDGTHLVFSNYEHEQYQVAVVPLEPEGAPVASGFRPPWNVPRIFGPVSDAARDSLRSLVRPYRPFPSMLVPRAVAPFVRLRESRLSTVDERLGLGLGLTVLGADVLQQWTYAATGYYQGSRPWGRITVENGTSVVRPRFRFRNEPRETTVVINDTTRARIPLEERSARLGFSLPLRLSANVHRTSLALGLNGDYRWLRLIDSESNPLTDFSRRLTVTPTAVFAYRLQTNIRDVIPNSGLVVTSTAEIDLYVSDDGRPARAWRTDLSGYLPFLSSTNRGIRLVGGVLTQTRGSILDTDTFVPRGYEDKPILGEGTYLKAGLEFFQPLAYIDRGLVLLPISIQSVYAYGFGEVVGDVADPADHYSSVGVGLGAFVKLFHNLRLNLRIAVARLIEDDEWGVSFR